MPRKKITDFPVVDQEMAIEEAAADVVEDEGLREPSDPQPPAEEKPANKPKMVKKSWSGITMWECPHCRETTFQKAEVKSHVCKKVRYRTEDDE